MMSPCENASASRSGDAAPKTFNAKLLKIKRLRGKLFLLKGAVPRSLEADIRTWKRYEMCLSAGQRDLLPAEVREGKRLNERRRQRENPVDASVQQGLDLARPATGTLYGESNDRPSTGNDASNRRHDPPCSSCRERAPIRCARSSPTRRYQMRPRASGCRSRSCWVASRSSSSTA